MEAFTCLLLTVVVASCDPAAQQYAEAAARVPRQHWEMVGGVMIWDHRGRACEPGDEREPDYWYCAVVPNGIVLPRRRRDADLLHEVGHIVSYRDGYSLLNAWRATFWPDGLAIGAAVNAYATTTPGEDFAEAYRYQVEGRLSACCAERSAWLRARLPELVPR